MYQFLIYIKYSLDDSSVDMWSLGCVIFELYAGKPLFDGKSDIEQLSKIIDFLGTPEQNEWDLVK